MSIQLVTYANQTVTPMNDAIIYEKAIDQNGIFYGCNVTVSSNNVNITGGYGIICGREFTIQSESIAVTLAPSGTLLGRLYVRLDLADADNPIQLLTATGNSLPALEQDADANYINGVWEMEIATFDVGVSSLSNVVETYETITGSKKYDKDIALLLSNLTTIISSYDSVSVSNNSDKYVDLYTATVNGVFIGNVAVGFPTNTTGRRAARIYTDDGNGTRTLRGSYYTIPPASGAGAASMLPIALKLTTGEIIGVRIYQNSGGALTTDYAISGIFIEG